MANDQHTQHYGPDVLARLSENADGMSELRRVYPWAADEIERLQQARHKAECNLVAADATVERLRAALADSVATLEGCAGALPPWSFMQDHIEKSLAAARAALASSGESVGVQLGAAAPADDAPAPFLWCPKCAGGELLPLGGTCGLCHNARGWHVEKVPAEIRPIIAERRAAAGLPPLWGDIVQHPAPRCRCLSDTASEYGVDPTSGCPVHGDAVTTSEGAK